jgi:mannose-6-phosphate isomerase
MRTNVYKLYNQIKHYEWGSNELIPQFLNLENRKGIPYAEMWMGTHIGAPSQVELDGKQVNLAEISGELPFLFKLIAVQKPLSIQAHPNKTQAEEGFYREEKQGLSLNAPVRNYKDTNHKPEIICAISPFQLMAGFREPYGIEKALEEFLLIAPPLKEMLSRLLRALVSGSISDFFHTLCNFSSVEHELLCAFILEKGPDESGGAILSEQWKLMKNFAAQYPGDKAVISPLYLNLIALQPGQAVFIPSGTLHAYLNGFGVELMTSSDNVLRGGLTSKHIDTGELINILYFKPFVPRIITPAAGEKWFCYKTPCAEFSLALMSGSGEEKAFPGNSPAVCIVTEGEMSAGSEMFKKGESFFISQGSDPLLFGGNYSLFAAAGGPQ